MQREYAIVGGALRNGLSNVVAMRGCTQFDITVQHENIRGTDFGDQYFRCFDVYMEEPFTMNKPNPLALICDYCLPLLKKLAPQISFQGLTIGDFLYAPYYTLQFPKLNISRQVQILGEENLSYRRAMHFSPQEIAYMPIECVQIPRFAADQINAESFNPGEGIHGSVLVTGDTRMYFKPREAGREKEFDTELPILNRIRQQQLAKGDTRLSNLQGIVVSGGNECVGLLMQLLPTKKFGDLLHQECWKQKKLHQKWEGQVRATVKVQHAYGMVWGDVNAGNVVIDEARNAWVIDFGARNNPEFVDDDKAETEEGDWQGVGRLFREWLPARNGNFQLDNFCTQTLTLVTEKHSF